VILSNADNYLLTYKRNIGEDLECHYYLHVYLKKTVAMTSYVFSRALSGSADRILSTRGLRCRTMIYVQLRGYIHCAVVEGPVSSSTPES